MRVFTCDGCDTDHSTEVALVACYESHPCHYCGGPIHYQTDHLLQACAGMLWCGCPDGASYDEE